MSRRNRPAAAGKSRPAPPAPAAQHTASPELPSRRQKWLLAAAVVLLSGWLGFLTVLSVTAGISR
jgi:hypothetical protein